MKLKDPYNRPVSNLRISLTPACNLRCMYCHAEGEVSPSGLLSARQIGEIMRVAREFEFRSVKFTGGEPTLRPDLPEIIQEVPEGMESSMTTNGTLLAARAQDLKDAGLSRVNISVDSLDPETYQRITGRDLLPDVLGHDLSVEQAYDTLAIFRIPLGVGHDDQCGAIPVKGFQQVHHLFSMRRIQVTCRFISQDELRFGDDRTGDGDTLLLAS